MYILPYLKDLFNISFFCFILFHHYPSLSPSKVYKVSREYLSKEYCYTHSAKHCNRKHECFKFFKIFLSAKIVECNSENHWRKQYWNWHKAGWNAALFNTSNSTRNECCNNADECRCADNITNIRLKTTPDVFRGFIIKLPNLIICFIA